MGRQRTWEKEELEYLEDKWGIISVKGISTKLNRSIDAINCMKNRLELGSFLGGNEYITFNQLLIALGNNTGNSYKVISWIKNRNFPVKYKTVLNNRFKIVYMNDFWKWAKENRTFINWSKVEVNIFGAEPEWVKDQRKYDYLKFSKIRMTPWTALEDENLRSQLRKFKHSYKELSIMLHRTEGAIQRRISDLGLKERPLKADNHTRWTEEEYLLLGELIKQGLNYELISDRIGKSVKAIRGRVYSMYLTENIDRAAALIGKGVWGDGRPEVKITHRMLSMKEKAQVKQDMTKFTTILSNLIDNKRGGLDL